MKDTIVALATPQGRSGIGVVRLSGSGVTVIAARMMASDRKLLPRRATLSDIFDQDARLVDRAILTYFPDPNSFTGEDVVEISCHGSPIILRSVLDLSLSLGARLASPGEFSFRALANGRMDLVEAEAIRDLINARTKTASQQALRQMSGEFSGTLHPLKEKLLEAIVVLESALEFVEDDLPPAQIDSVSRDLELISAQLNAVAMTYQAGKLIRDGLRVVIAGRPNVGKSTLFNALLGSDRAIVSEIEGTTRDHLHEQITVDGVPISLIDTAGLRSTDDPIESIGVERTKAIVADADVVVIVTDPTRGIGDYEIELINSLESVPKVIAFNKIDTATHEMRAAADEQLSQLSEHYVLISATDGSGLAKLTHLILEAQGREDSVAQGLLITDARHYDLLTRTCDEINASREELTDGRSEEMVLVGLHNALLYLGEITGETTTEAVLTRIFSTFCIGK